MSTLPPASTGTVLLAPSDNDHDAPLRRSVLAQIPRVQAIVAADGPTDALAARACAGIADLAVTSPVTLVACGASAQLVPALARALRARQTPVAHFLLVEPVLPPVTDAWPDAPVTVACAEDSDLWRMAGYRGWQRVSPMALTASVDLTDR